MSAVRPARARVWRAVFALAAVGVSAAFVLTTSPRLGLDLKGGTQIVLETQDTERVEADAESTDRALEVLRGRVDALGVAEPTLARAGDRRIIVELPDVQDPREAVEVIGKTAQLSFHEVTRPARIQKRPTRAERLVLDDETGSRFVLGPAVLDGDGVEDAEAAQPQESWAMGCQRHVQRLRCTRLAELWSTPPVQHRGRPTHRHRARRGRHLLAGGST